MVDANAKTPSNELYTAYKEFCDEDGLRAKGKPSFTPQLLELCTSRLNHQVSIVKTKTTRNWHGVRIRSKNEMSAGGKLVETTIDRPLVAEVAEQWRSGGEVVAEQNPYPVTIVAEVAEQIENSRLEKIEEKGSDASEEDLHGGEKEQITLPLSPPLPLSLVSKDLSGGEVKNTIATSAPPLPPTSDRGLRLTQATLHKFKVGDRVTNEKLGRTGTIVEIRVKTTPRGTEYTQCRVDFGFDSCWFEDVVLQPHKTAA